MRIKNWKADITCIEFSKLKLKHRRIRTIKVLCVLTHATHSLNSAQAFNRLQYAYPLKPVLQQESFILPFHYRLRLGDKSADLDLDPEGDLDTLPGDDLQ
jgi:hypothetical protein